MRSALLLIGIHLVYAGMDSHIDIYTASKGVAGISVFVAATVKVIKEIKVFPMQDLFRGAVDEQFQQNNTKSPPTMHQTLKDNKNIAMERFNQAEEIISVTDSPHASQPSKPVGIQQKSVPLEEEALLEEEEAFLKEALRNLRNLRGQQKSDPLEEEALREILLCSPSRSSSTTRRRPVQ